MFGDLKEAYETILVKSREYNRFWDYYEGRQPLRWSMTRPQKVLEQFHPFVQNWCAVVVDSVIDRLELNRFNVVGQPTLSTRIDEIMSATGMELDSDDVHREAEIVGESFVIAWKDPETNEIEIYRNDARQTHLFYDPMKPRVKRFAVKQWVDDDENGRMVLYYPDQIEYWVSRKKWHNMSEFKEGDWQPDEEFGGVAQNPFGEIPVFHFMTDSRCSSDLANALPIQDIVNKTLSDMVVVAEYAAYPQRWAITAAEIDGPLPVSPQSTLTIPPAMEGEQASSIGVFPSAEMSNFLSIIDSMAHSIAIITRTPKHYFFAQGGDPSGEALIAMEAPLAKKISRFQKRLSYAWEEMATFVLRVDGKTVNQSNVTAVWNEIETIQPMTRAMIRKTNVEAGLPLITVLRDEGWTDEELEQYLDDLTVTEVRSTPGAGPEATPTEVNAVVDQNAADMEALAQAAIEAVAEGAIDAITRSGVLNQVANQTNT